MLVQPQDHGTNLNRDEVGPKPYNLHSAQYSFGSTYHLNRTLLDDRCRLLAYLGFQQSSFRTRGSGISFVILRCVLAGRDTDVTIIRSKPNVTCIIFHRPDYIHNSQSLRHGRPDIAGELIHITTHP